MLVTSDFDAVTWSRYFVVPVGGGPCPSSRAIPMIPSEETDAAASIGRSLAALIGGEGSRVERVELRHVDPRGDPGAGGRRAAGVRCRARNHMGGVEA